MSEDDDNGEEKFILLILELQELEVDASFAGVDTWNKHKIFFPTILIWRIKYICTVNHKFAESIRVPGTGQSHCLGDEPASGGSRADLTANRGKSTALGGIGSSAAAPLTRMPEAQHGSRHRSATRTYHGVLRRNHEQINKTMRIDVKHSWTIMRDNYT